MDNAAAPGKRLTPSAIVTRLDQYVVGQDEAKRTLAVAVYAHYRKLARRADSHVEMVKSNILLIGPTGTGKTLICETLSRVLGVPFVTADATSLAQSKYINEELGTILSRLVERAGGDLLKAGRGIVFIDEIDKLKTADSHLGNISGERVQHALLKIMEGAHVRLADERLIDTSNVLFICAGAFVGLEKITSKSHTYGFVSTSSEEDAQILNRINARIKPTDLFEFGLIPEFAGRLPIITVFQSLTREMLAQIMVAPKNSIYNQFREMFRNEGVELTIDARVFEQIAELAFEYKVGARSLRGIFEEMITPVLFQTPDRPEIRKVHIESLFTEAKLFTAPATG